MPVKASASVWVLCSDDDVIDEAVALGTTYSMTHFLEGRMAHLELHGLDVFDRDRLTGWGSCEAFEHQIAKLRTTSAQRVSEALSRLERVMQFERPQHLDTCKHHAAAVLRYVEETIQSNTDARIADWEKINDALNAFSLATSNTVHQKCIFVDCTTSILTSDIPTEDRLQELMDETHRRLVLVPVTLHF